MNSRVKLRPENSEQWPWVQSPRFRRLAGHGTATPDSTSECAKLLIVSRLSNSVLFALPYSGLQRCLIPWCTCPHSQASLGSPGAAVQGSCRLDPHHEVGHVAPDALFPGTCSGCFRAERQPPTDFILPCCTRMLSSSDHRRSPLPALYQSPLPPSAESQSSSGSLPSDAAHRVVAGHSALHAAGRSTSLHGAAVVESLWDGTRNTSRRAGELFRLRLTLAPAGHTPLHAVRTGTRTSWP